MLLLCLPGSGRVAGEQRRNGCPSVPWPPPGRAASASSFSSLPLPSLGLHSQSSAVSWEMGIQGILGWMGDCALQSLSCRLGHSVQSSCAAEYCREPSTFKRKGCSLAPPWLFLIFIFCQLLEVHKMSILRALLSCDRP